MTRSKSEKGRRKIPSGETRAIGDAIAKRHIFGSTEKILRRNRKTWVRLANKRRRAEDKRKIEE